MRAAKRAHSAAAEAYCPVGAIAAAEKSRAYARSEASA